VRGSWENTKLIEDSLPVYEKTQQQHGEITTESDYPKNWRKEGRKFEEVEKHRGR